MQIELQFQDQQALLKRNLNEISLCRLLKASKRRLQGVPEQFGLQYIDTEGDIVDIICEEDLQTLKESLKNNQGTLVITVNPDGYPVMVDFKKGKEECHKRWQEKKKHFKQKGMEFIKKTVQDMIPEIVQEVRKSIIVQEQPQFQTEKPVQEEKPIHDRVRCDGCNTFPIVGIRYKCSVCQDFDFCEKCESDKVHDHSHAFLKIKNPNQAPSFIMTAVGGQPDMRIPRCMRNFVQRDIDIPQMIQKAQQFFQNLQQPEQQQQVQQVPVMIPKVEPKIEPVIDSPVKKQEIEEEAEILLTGEQEQKLIQLSEMLSVNPNQIRQVIIDYDGFPVEEIAQYLTECPEFLAQLERSKYQ